jgi:hypothetical protein
MTEIHRLNMDLGLCFGFSPVIDTTGEYVKRGTAMPKFCWRRTSDMFYYLENGSREVRVGSLIVIEPTYQRISFAKRYGQKWCLAHWSVPSREGWPKEFAFPANGRFCPVENVMFDEGERPSQEANEAVIHLINRQLTDPVTAQDIEAQAAKDEAARQSQINDMVDDAAFAFYQEPSTKGNVSFPLITKRVQ